MNRISSVRLQTESEGWSMKFKLRSAVIWISAVVAAFAFMMACASAAYGYWGRFALAVVILCMNAFTIGGLIDD